MKQEKVSEESNTIEVTEDDLTEWIEISVKGIISNTYDKGT